MDPKSNAKYREKKERRRTKKRRTRRAEIQGRQAEIRFLQPEAKEHLERQNPEEVRKDLQEKKITVVFGHQVSGDYCSPMKVR